jgi:hypothetical protein
MLLGVIAVRYVWLCTLSAARMAAKVGWHKLAKDLSRLCICCEILQPSLVTCGQVGMQHCRQRYLAALIASSPSHTSGLGAPAA